jgi:hypothetical protein
MLALTSGWVAVIAAGAAILGAALTGAVQFLIERYRRNADRTDRATERYEDQLDRERDRKRDLYKGLLRFLRQLPNDINEYVVDEAGPRQ